MGKTPTIMSKLLRVWRMDEPFAKIALQGERTHVISSGEGSLFAKFVFCIQWLQNIHLKKRHTKWH